MSKFLALFLICAILYQTTSAIFLNPFKNPIARKIKCDVHKIGRVIHNHDHDEDPCQESQVQEISENNIDNIELEVTTPVSAGQKPDTTTPDSSNDDIVTVPQGKRLIAIGSNCQEGFKSDSKGRCREQY